MLGGKVAALCCWAKGGKGHNPRPILKNFWGSSHLARMGEASQRMDRHPAGASTDLAAHYAFGGVGEQRQRQGKRRKWEVGGRRRKEGSREKGA